MKVNFLNHASFLIEEESFSLVVDPWFFGKIFNDSWSLLRDTDDSIIDYNKLKYISISHEHPDHFHLGTLKHIRSKTDNDVTVIFPERKNDNVKEACEKMGFKFQYLNYFQPHEIEQDFKITAFPEGHDNALVYEADGKIIVNQNDAYLNHETCQIIKQKYPEIDLWLFQFSLAGYYGNRDDALQIYQKGTKFHEEKYLYYQDFFSPKVSVPFASYVYFCKEYNNYLNSHRVKLHELVKSSNYYNQIPFYNKEITLEAPVDNLDLWEREFSEENTKISKPKEFPSEEVILEKFSKLISKGYQLHNGYLIVGFFDYEKKLLIDTANKVCLFLSEEQLSNGDEEIGLPKIPQWKNLLSGTLTGEELSCYLDMPWGADTLNITGCFDVHNEALWVDFKMAKDRMYIR
jgi:hypothetical protein